MIRLARDINQDTSETYVVSMISCSLPFSTFSLGSSEANLIRKVRELGDCTTVNKTSWVLGGLLGRPVEALRVI